MNIIENVDSEYEDDAYFARKRLEVFANEASVFIESLPPLHPLKESNFENVVLSLCLLDASESLKSKK